MHMQASQEPAPLTVELARNLLLDWMTPGKVKPGAVEIARAIFVLVIWFTRGGSDGPNVIGSPEFALNDELAARKLAAIDGGFIAVSAAPLSAWWPLVEYLVRRLVDELLGRLLVDVPKSAPLGVSLPFLKPIILSLAGKAFDWAAERAPEIAEFRPLVMAFIEKLLAKESA